MMLMISSDDAELMENWNAYDTKSVIGNNVSQN